ncbi:MAG TPA: hypothetical protein VF883_12260 [Thermoanaerobaculia bacterium]|jgi:hypothetical protein
MRFKSTFCAIVAGVIIALSGAQAVEACMVFTSFRTSSMDVYFCQLRDWDSSSCYYSCTRIPNATLAF